MDVRIPELGDFKDVEVVEVLVADGSRVEAEDPIITLETDKASMEVPAPKAGVISGLTTAVGDRVNPGDIVCHLEVEETDAPAEKKRSNSRSFICAPGIANRSAETTNTPCARKWCIRGL